MAIFKTLHIFDAVDQTAGWQEVWYLDAGNLDEAQTKSLAIATKRVTAVSAGFNLEWIRCSANAQPPTPGVFRQRNANLRRVSLNGSYPGTLTTDADTVWQAARCRFSDATEQIFRPVLMRGLPDTSWSQGNDKILKAFFTQWLPGFVATLVANSAQIMHLVRGNPLRTPTPIARGFFEQISKRDTGRPLFLYRGRATKST